MARYIDADKIDYRFTVVGADENAGYRAVAFESDIDEIPTADVAPKSDVEIWKQNRFNLYQRLELYKITRQEVAREIFDEIEREIDSIRGMNFAMQALDDFLAELKKKYTEASNEMQHS